MKKRGLSVMIGYVLLVGIVIVLSIVFYSWAKTYIPVQTLKCPEDTSLFVKSFECTDNLDGTYNLNLTLKNNGRFNVGGYFIRAANGTEELATLDLMNDLDGRILLGGEIAQTWMEPGVKFTTTHGASGEANVNPLEPDQEIITRFEINTPITFVEIIPIRWQTSKGLLTTCGLSKITEEVTCS